ncbi:chromosome segregation ATPase [Burkholderia sp. PvR073]|uniref:hypothetical protein n=1 Tax=Burkholderia TaxID=32008 RepID=UPI00254B404A|nr:hypothetical protein [Burkholderia sp. lyk4-R2A-23]
MQDRSSKAFRIVVGRLERLDATLRETLRARIDLLDDAQARLDEHQDAMARVRDELARQDERIKRLVGGGGPVRIDELLGWQAQRSRVAAEHDSMRVTLNALHDEIARIEEEVAEARAAIVRNDARITLCKQRLAALHAQAQRDLDDMLDEETEEGVVARMLSRRRARPDALTRRQG